MKITAKLTIYTTTIILILFISVALHPELLTRKLSAIEYAYNKHLGAGEEVAVFTRIYADDFWGKGSGVGSVPGQAAPYITLLQKYFNDPRFHTIVDLGCGDWQIMSSIKISNDKVYKGYDLVKSVQDQNRKQYAKANVQFYDIKSLRDFETQNVTADLLVIKDVMQHWPIEEIQYFISNILPKFKYALITNSYTTDFSESKIYVNSEIPLGRFRPLSLTTSPFNLRHVTVALEYGSLGVKQVLFYVNPKERIRKL